MANGKHPLNQQEQNLASWGVSIHTETDSSVTSCVFNSWNYYGLIRINLDLQLCEWEENQPPERKTQRLLSRFSWGVRYYTQDDGVIFGWQRFIYSMLYFINGSWPYIPISWSHILKILEVKGNWEWPVAVQLCCSAIWAQVQFYVRSLTNLGVFSYGSSVSLLHKRKYLLFSRPLPALRNNTMLLQTKL